MYNHELKSEFLDQYKNAVSDTARRSYECVFNRIAPFEERWQADVCTRTTEEAEEMLRQITGLRMFSAKNIMYFLMDYVNWCIENGVPDACDGMLHMTVDRASTADSYREKTVANPQHLQQFLDTVFVPVETGTVDVIWRSAYWLSFAGLRNEEIRDVKVSDVDLNNLVISCNGEEYPIYREGYPAIRAAATMETIAFAQKNYRPGLYRQLERAPGDRLLRGTSDYPSYKHIHDKISVRLRDAKQAGIITQPITIDRVWLSGVFYRWYELERIGIKPQINLFCADLLRKKAAKNPDFRGSNSRYASTLAVEYRRDYAKWKEAHTTV